MHELRQRLAQLRLADEPHDLLDLEVVRRRVERQVVHVDSEVFRLVQTQEVSGLRHGSVEVVDAAVERNVEAGVLDVMAVEQTVELLEALRVLRQLERVVDISKVFSNFRITKIFK